MVRSFLPRSLLLLTMTLLVGQGCAHTQLDPPATVAEHDPRLPATPAFYSDGPFGDISEYGFWIHSAPYGWVWQPDVSAYWRPFEEGHWVWSEWGWTWISYEPFGWAVYHYGNWVYDTIWEWIWIPAYEWSPSRVEWVEYDDYICWAPTPPDGIHYNDPWLSAAHDPWVVCEPEHFTSLNISGYTNDGFRPKPPRAKHSVQRSAPDVRYVAKRTGRAVRPVKITVKEQTIEKKKITRMVLPPDQRRTIERHSPRVKKKTRPAPGRREELDRKKGPKGKTKPEAPDGKETPTKKRSGGKKSKKDSSN